MPSSSSAAAPIRPRVRAAVVDSLRAGVVPSSGLQHVQVGRADEVAAVVADIDRIADRGSAFRLVVGDFGAGKSFFLSLMRSVALERRLVTVHADLSPDRRLQSTGGQARSLYCELMRNLSTRAQPRGGAMASVVERFVTESLKSARARSTTPEVVIHDRLADLQELTGGYDFAEVIAAYWRGYDTGNDQLQSDVVRWLRGEFPNRTQARRALGVSAVVTDSSFYDHLKLFARFVRHAGYRGMLVCLDEMVNLYTLSHTQSRQRNYEKVLGILNDCLQGSAAGLGFVLGATTDTLTDERRGLYSYPALRTRLAENRFAADGLVDYSGPVLRLDNLSPEDMYVLLTKLRHVFASGDENAYLVPDEALHAFMGHCHSRVGDAYFRTPRNTVKEFLDLLAVIDQNPGVQWQDLIERVEVAPEANPDLEPLTDGDWPATPAAVDDDLATVRF